MVKYASLKLIKRLNMTLGLVLMDHILNYIFKMEYETHAYGIEFDSKTFLKSEMKK